MGFMKRKKAGAAFTVAGMPLQLLVRGSLAVACPYCKAKVGVPCRTKSGSATDESHAARKNLSRSFD
jgi:hypothetical protein